jgi:hypothetical protein
VDLKKNIFYSGLKILETRKLGSINGKQFVKQKNEGRKQDKNSSLRRLKFMPRKLD